MGVFFVTIFGQKFRQKKEQNPSFFLFSSAFYFRCRIIVFQDLLQLNFMRTKTLNFSSSGGVFYTHQFAELLPSLPDLGTLMRHAIPFLIFRPFNPSLFPMPFSWQQNQNPPTMEFLFIDVWKFLNFRNILYRIFNFSGM